MDPAKDNNLLAAAYGSNTDGPSMGDSLVADQLERDDKVLAGTEQDEAKRVQMRNAQGE